MMQFNRCRLGGKGRIISMENIEEFDISGQEITVSELSLWKKGSYTLIDVRDEMSYAYGHLPEAIHISFEQLEKSLSELSGSRLVVYCKKGEISVEAVKLLREKGIEAYNLKGGYIAWLMEIMKQEQKNDKDVQETFCADV